MTTRPDVLVTGAAGFVGAALVARLGGEGRRVVGVGYAEEAAIPTLEEVLERAANRTGGSVPLSAAAKAVRSDRDRR